MASLIRITDRHLLRTLLGFPTEDQQDPSLRTYLLSLAIVKHYFGEKWFEDHVKPNGSPGFLRQDTEDRMRSEIQSFRIIDLAEVLFNLQYVEGFDDCIKRMKQGQIESTYAEPDLGRMLYVSEIDFRFVITSGKKGDDYDIEMKLSDGIKVCADAKCKIESTNFTAETVRHTLDKARKQFPPDRASIIFVKVPPQWRSEPLPVSDILYEVAKDFLRGTGRIVSVKYFTSRIVWNNGAITHVHAFKEFSNPANRIDPDRNWDMFVGADKTVQPNTDGNVSDVPQRWRRLIYYPQGLRKQSDD
jgi:hypothetical protein